MPRSAGPQVVPLGGRPVQVRPGYGITIVPLAQHLGDLGGPVHPAAGGLARGHPDRSRPQRDPVQRHRRRAAERGRDPGRPRRRLDGRQVDRPVPAAARQCRGGHPGAAGDLRAVRPDRRRALADPLPAPGTDERGAGDRRRPRADARGRRLGRRGSTVARRWASQFYVYNLKHAAAEDVAKLLNEAFSEGAASSDRAEPRRGAAPPWAAAQPLERGRRGGAAGRASGDHARRRRPRRVRPRPRAGQGRGEQGQQLAADPRHAGRVRPHRGHPGAPGHGALAGADRGHHRRGHAERHAALRRAVFPGERQLCRRLLSQAQRGQCSSARSRAASTSCSPQAAAKSASTLCHA